MIARFCQWCVWSISLAAIAALIVLLIVFAGALIAWSIDWLGGDSFYWSGTFSEWLVEVTRSLFPWPVTIVFLVVYIVNSPSALTRIRMILRQIRRVKIGSAEVELNQEEREEIEHTAEQARAFLSAYREQLNSAIRRKIAVLDLSHTLQITVENHIKLKLREKKLPVKFRCTVHIPDFIYQYHLLQLLDYYPVGGGFGRDFSERYGIIGKVWRSGLPQLEGNLTGDKRFSDKPADEKIQFIARNWGMSIDEARRALDRPSYACAILEHESRRVGLIYMDSTGPFAFSDEGEPSDSQKNQAFLEDIKNACDTTGLTKRVSEVLTAFESVSPKISFGDRH